MAKTNTTSKKRATTPSNTNTNPNSTTTTRPSPRNQSSTQRANPSNGLTTTTTTLTLTILFLITTATSVLIYRLYFTLSPPPPPPPHLTSPLHRKGLVTPHVTHLDILNEHSKVEENYTLSHRNFPNDVLAYITPWNSAGYDIAKRFANKFTHLSPVWYDLKSQGKELVLEGRHNADKGWLSELRARGNAKVLPRVVLETEPKALLKNKKQRDKAINLIIKECMECGYDGIVLESWSRWAIYGVLHDPAVRKMALQFIKQLGDAMHNTSLGSGSKQLELVFVIAPPNSEKLLPHDFGAEDLRTVSETVDGFSLMTYDYSSPYAPGPNAPLKWVHSTLEILLGGDSKKFGKKIFVGLNFYGNDYVLAEDGGGQAILGRDYLTLLNQHKPVIKWQKEFAEHLFMYNDNKHVQHAVFYPTLLSISQRLEEAHSRGAGISIWEIGQGLDYFYDLL